MQEFPADQIHISEGFWQQRQTINAKKAIFHQWAMLEASGCIDNFRIAAGEKEGFRDGWFFADSDATKWLDAASRIERNEHDEELCRLMDELIRLLGKVQTDDGYLFTYNQLHFRGQRWVNLQIEHELYCHGHLIEAGVSHYEATGREDMLTIAKKAADLLVRDFLAAGPQSTPGHEEVEIALLRLWKITGDNRYKALAEHFLDNRGKTKWFGIHLLRQLTSNTERGKTVEKARIDYATRHSGAIHSRVPAANQAKKPRLIQPRYFLNTLSGKFFQQHKPVGEQTVPVGHAVRFGYLQTAQAMRLGAALDSKTLGTMAAVWERMVNRRMDVTGGVGALPLIEGFGRDYELDPECAYNETCAAIASLLWNWQLTQLTGKMKFADLFEWQLYNAVLVGMGWNGDTYLYNNPTRCRGGITRQPWYSVPCCPSNLSRTFADLGKYIYGADGQDFWVNQYISSVSPLSYLNGFQIKLQSELPWRGTEYMTVHTPQSQTCNIHLRLPSWAGGIRIAINDQDLPLLPVPTGAETTASGVLPQKAGEQILSREWKEGDIIQMNFDLPIRVLEPDQKVRGVRGRIAVTRGPLVYCLESVDNPEIDIFNCRIDESSLHFDETKTILDGVSTIYGSTIDEKEARFIPYACWGNRGPSGMNVWVGR
jgi:DUF1680 family protein